MKLTASLVVMSHLSDAQEMIGQPNPQWANDNINFAKFYAENRKEILKY